MFTIKESKLSGQTFSVPKLLKSKISLETERYRELESRYNAEESYRWGKLSHGEADALKLKFADRGLNLLEDQFGTVWQRDGDSIIRVDEDLSWIDELQAKQAQKRPQPKGPYEGPTPLESLPGTGTSDKSKDEINLEKRRKPKQHSKGLGTSDSGGSKPEGHIPPWNREEPSSSSGAGTSVSYEHRTDDEPPFAYNYKLRGNFSKAAQAVEAPPKAETPESLPTTDTSTPPPPPEQPLVPFSKPKAVVHFFYDDHDDILKIEVLADQRPSGEIITKLEEATGKNIKMFGVESAIISISYGKSRFPKREAEDILAVLSEYYDIEVKSKRLAFLTKSQSEELEQVPPSDFEDRELLSKPKEEIWTGR